MHQKIRPKVILIGGAPMVGKSTVARKLAARLEYACLSTDDIGQAIGAVTTAQSHPAFHEMDGLDYREYYATRSVDDLIADAERRHAALWPAIAQMIIAHATWGDPMVLEGWALCPTRVAQLGLSNVASLWLVADDDVLAARVRAAVDFYTGAADEEAMIRHFVTRSRWYNRLVCQQAGDLGFPIIPVVLSDDSERMVTRCRKTLEDHYSLPNV
ncbi:MAG TPA: AAA family ATPase [Armatimonadota bacterium]|jgi:2-phosphoglycerate kinase